METQELGNRIKERRRILRIQQQDLSEIAGVALHTLSDIESGKGNPTLQSINKICDVLGMEVQLTVKRS